MPFGKFGERAKRMAKAAAKSGKEKLDDAGGVDGLKERVRQRAEGLRDRVEAEVDERGGLQAIAEGALEKGKGLLADAQALAAEKGITIEAARERLSEAKVQLLELGEGIVEIYDHETIKALLLEPSTKAEIVSKMMRNGMTQEDAELKLKQILTRSLARENKRKRE